MEVKPIAIIGIGCRFPGANNPQGFWNLLTDGVDVITEVPKSRWNSDEFYHPDAAASDKTNSRWGGFLDKIDQFDPHFFGISPREALTIDPQQRLLMEVAWEALEDGMQIPQQLAGTKTGVFIGIGTHDYSLLLWQNPVNEAHASTGTANCVAANRLSYFFDFKGPSFAVDTACSSSLVAVHLACKSLWSGESSLALAGGVNALLMPTIMVGFTKSGLMAPDGRCKTFDARADGYVRSEGAGIVLLKPLEKALEDGDPIYAVIRGSAVNQDGRSNGLSTPNVDAQKAVLREAYRVAGISPGQVQYVEAHGTGTKVGDAVELEALGEVLAENRPEGEICAIGSVKTNIGHTETAAGIAGLIKAALLLKYRQIPPSLHCQNLNPAVNWDRLPLRVQQQLTSRLDCQFVGVSSFGFGGTNSHVVLEGGEFARNQNSGEQTSDHSEPYLLTISAKTEPALRDLAVEYERFLGDRPEMSLRDVCFSASTRRSHFSHRLAIQADSHRQLCDRLHAFADGQNSAGVGYQTVTAKTPPKVTFLCAGQGSQLVGMGLELYRKNLIFRKNLDRCNEILSPYLGRSLLSILTSEDGDLHQTAYTQPALFALEYALAQLWISLGIKPAVVLGHSVGEYVAACLAGVFSLEDGSKLIAARGKLMQSLPPDGGMVAVFTDEKTLKSTIADGEVAIAAVNAPNIIVISGNSQYLKNAVEKLGDRGIKTTPLNVSHAFHSPAIAPILDEFHNIASEITYNPPKISIISNVTGEAIGSEIATPEYWCEHILKTVRFSDSIATLNRLGSEIWLEISPQATLLGMIRSGGIEIGQKALLPSLRPGQELRQLLSAVGEVYLQGIAVEWPQLYGDKTPNLVQLPTYPFQRQSYWWPTAKYNLKHSLSATSPQLHPLLGERLRLSGTGEIRFQSRLSSQSPDYLQDHRLFSQPVFPAAAYIEMVLAAARELRETVRISQLTIEEPLKLSPEETAVKVILTPENDRGEYEFKIYSLMPGKVDRENLHARGILTPAQFPIPELEMGGDFREILPSYHLDISEYYQNVHKQGLNYGEAFRGIRQLWRGENEALGQIELPEFLRTETQLYTLHPVLLDACFQVLGAILLGQNDRTTYLPVSIENLQVYRHPGDRVWSRAQITTATPQMITARLQIFDDRENLVAEIETLTLRAINIKSLQELFPTSDHPASNLTEFYISTWEPKPLVYQSRDRHSEEWLIVSDARNLGLQLAESLEEKGDRCFVLSARDLPASLPPCQNILYLWSCDRDPLEETGANLLNFVKTIVRKAEKMPSRLWLVTHSSNPLKISKNYVFGLARVIRLEHPDLHCTCLDFDCPLNVNLPGIDKANSAVKLKESEHFQAVLEELGGGDGETQITYRHGIRHVARLETYDPDLKTPEPYQLKISKSGTLEQFDFVPLRRKSPGFGEVEIQVRAVGLNFRDVLNALGMLNQYLEQIGIKNPSEIPLGGECSGIVTSVGQGVEGLNVGDPVIAALTPGSLGSSITVDRHFVIPKPTHLNFVEAATISTAFLTAYYALVELAQLKAGDRVLIHAASGGVGQAAVQIAQKIGAEIYGTASPAKQRFLKSMGVQFVMNSRDLAFAEQVMELTGGKGVDVVLNSLNGEFIPKSLDILAPNGRFIEIGKIGIWDVQDVRKKRSDITYQSFDLLEIAEYSPPLISRILSALSDEFERRTLNPLPHTVFPVEETSSAFRHLAQAKHIGKVAIAVPPVQPLKIRADSTYLITGGLGALGLQVARWLATKGAKHLLLIGRGEPSPAAKTAIAQLQEQGIDIRISKTDVTDFSALENSIKPYCIPGKLPPLRGIIHAAGVLEDGTLQNQTWDQFKKVLAPKVTGTLNLHETTLSLPLDFFVCFSSIVALLGSPGQANYVVANSIVDGLMEYRRNSGLPGLSINWGPWEQTGMAAQLSHQNKGRLSARGMIAIAPHQGLQIIEKLIGQNQAQIGAFSVNWSDFIRQVPDGVALPFLEKIVSREKATEAESETHPEPQSDFLQQLATTAAGDRKIILFEKIRGELSAVLGYQPEDINWEDNFSDLGMDSLMAVEFKNRLQNCLGSSFSLTSVLDYPDLEALVDYFLAEILTEDILNQSLKTPRISRLTPTPYPKPAPSEMIPENLEIPPEYYQFHRSPEYLSLERDLEKGEKLGNPFFRIYEGVARETVETGGRELINYATYNYLGLCGDPQVSELAQRAIARYGTSVSASRIVAGERSLHQELEREIANFLGTEDCIVYIGGHATNVTTIGHLFGEKDLILYDALSHNSIHQGCLLSGATAIEFPHNDRQSLETLLQQKRRQFEKVLIAIEGVYSTEGDIAPLPEIVELKRKYKAFLMVDEAHSVGVLGAGGRGVSEYFNIAASEVDLWMGTLSKSFASCGGYIAGNRQLVKYLKYTAPGFVFSVGMSPPNTAAALAALQILQKEPGRVAQLQERARLFLTLAKQQGLNTGASSDSPIIPIIVGDYKLAARLTQSLFERGINVYPMVYPSVPYNAARLRFFITATHTEAQIKFTVETLTEELKKLG
ncbi:MAG: aminotransferase class I/II-fold pyridoxal phosphate-dependent enzyme [Limnospira sp.]